MNRLLSRSFSSSWARMKWSKEVTAPGSKVNKPDQGAEVAVHYTGKLENGEVFDCSRTRGQPIRFRVGTGQVIRGWDEGIMSMDYGERAVLTIPPEYGYGAQGVGPIPPNSTLIFDVELVE